MLVDMDELIRRRVIAEWDEELRKNKRRWGITSAEAPSGADVVREIRDEYDQGRFSRKS
ncbi:hypothetical protein [Nocardia harenae]|uniref:hypothetical protein n=1 Tax=Nocardia harenae TaxID=358707 RepID=UPI000AA86116|nr:hypothetical protein [Nocardia harenae]